MRLYSVDERGRRGIVFRSLDADRLAVVLGARLGLGLPYVWSRLGFRAAARTPPSSTPPLRRTGRVAAASCCVPGRSIERPSGLEEWLTGRWGLHTRLAGATRYLTNEHEVWPLHRAEVLALDDGLVAAAGLRDVAARPPDSVLWSPGVRAAFGPPERRARARVTRRTRPPLVQRSTCVILWRAAWVDAATGNDRTEWTWASSRATSHLHPTSPAAAVGAGRAGAGRADRCRTVVRQHLEAALPSYGPVLAAGFPFLVDFLILGASLQYIAGARVGASAPRRRRGPRRRPARRARRPFNDPIFLAPAAVPTRPNRPRCSRARATARPTPSPCCASSRTSAPSSSAGGCAARLGARRAHRGPGARAARHYLRGPLTAVR